MICRLGSVLARAEHVPGRGPRLACISGGHGKGRRRGLGGVNAKVAAANGHRQPATSPLAPRFNACSATAGAGVLPLPVGRAKQVAKRVLRARAESNASLPAGAPVTRVRTDHGPDICDRWQSRRRAVSPRSNATTAARPRPHASPLARPRQARPPREHSHASGRLAIGPLAAPWRASPPLGEMSAVRVRHGRGSIRSRGRSARRGIPPLTTQRVLERLHAVWRGEGSAGWPLGSARGAALRPCALSLKFGTLRRRCNPAALPPARRAKHVHRRLGA